MTREQIEQIGALLDGTDIIRLDLTGPQGHWRISHVEGQTHIAFVSSEERVAVKAPHAGVFLTSHPLRNSPLLAQADQVTKGQVMGLLQVGPLLQPILAPCSGLVMSAAVLEGTLVGYGTILFELQAETDRS